jgi:hypothetical protein
LAPAVIFADANILSYRSDLSEPAPTELSAAFHGRRESPLGEMVASSDACPAVDGSTGAADRESTITLFFTADSGATHVSGEFTLWRQVNDSSPVAMVRHVLRDGRLPFLEYRYVVPTDGGVDSLATVPRGLLPISRRDTVSSVVDVRALRAVEWHFLVPLDSATRPRIARVHLVTSLPAVSQLDRHECRETSHDPPLLAGRDRDGAGTGASQPPPGRLRAVA